MRYPWQLLVLALVCASCSTSPVPTTSAAAAFPVHGQIISRITARDRSIVIRSGATGPTYSVETRNGEVIVGDMTLDQLALKNPDLFKAVRAMEAATQWAGE